jgi:hypothetical protein
VNVIAHVRMQSKLIGLILWLAQFSGIVWVLKNWMMEASHFARCSFLFLSVFVSIKISRKVEERYYDRSLDKMFLG